MSGLSYVGTAPATSPDITNKLAVDTVVATTTPNQSWATAQAQSIAAATYATLAYVDTQDATFATPAYVAAQDALYVPNTAVGTALSTELGTSGYYGVASLNSSAQVPIGQMPVLGAGYLKGPWGCTATFAGTTSNSPMRIADWNLGITELTCWPLVFFHAFVTGVMSYPIIEIRVADSLSAPAYSAMTLVGAGQGRSLYNDYATVSVVPAPSTTGESYPTPLPPGYHVWLTAWLWDMNSQSVSIASGGIVNSAAFLLRAAE